MDIYKILVKNIRNENCTKNQNNIYKMLDKTITQSLEKKNNIIYFSKSCKTKKALKIYIETKVLDSNAKRMMKTKIYQTI